MKKLIAFIIALGLSASALATTYNPVQLLNPVGSAAGQVVLSAGPSSTVNWGNVPATALAAQAANTVVANVTGSSASPTAFAMPSCSTSASALNWTSGTGFTCNTSVNAAQLGGATFAAPGPIGSTTASTGAFTTLSASGTVSGAGFSAYLASPPAIGTTAAAAGKFTTLQATSTITPSSTAGIVGTVTNDSANAGSMGEYLPVGPTASGISSGTNTNIASESLTAGDYDVECTVQYTGAAGTVTTGLLTGISTTSATFGTVGTFTQLQGSLGTASAQALPTPTVRESLPSTTTVYCVGNATFTTSTMTTIGYLRARRIR